MGDGRRPCIWLLGENEGTTANNNAFYFWRYIAAQREEIQAFFVLTDTAAHRRFFRELSPFDRKRIVWKNSRRHVQLYRAADLFLVSFSVRDILPDRICGKKIRFRLKKPLVYLQHGTTAIKKLGYTGDSYGNHLLRFMVYNPQISGEIVEKNGFAPYQLWFAGFHPRYQEMSRRLLAQKQAGVLPRGILWFLTWREYFEDKAMVRRFLQIVRAVLTDSRLTEYLEQKQETLTLCIHHLFDETAGEELLAIQKELSPRIRLIRQQDVDIMACLLESRLLITDYSSVGFDFAFLGRPVLMFMPDLQEYLSQREIYCRPEELSQEGIFRAEDLVEHILRQPDSVPRFYRTRLLPDIPYEAISKGVYLQKMYASLCEMQRRRIVLLGVDFGTVSEENAAALRLAEWLLGRGYWVELQSLKTHAGEKAFPCGLTHNAFYDEDARVPWQRLRRIGKKRRLSGTDEAVAPYARLALRRWLRRCRCADAVVISPALCSDLCAIKAPGIGRLWTVCRPEESRTEFPAVQDGRGEQVLNTRSAWETVFPPLLDGVNYSGIGGEKR